MEDINKGLHALTEPLLVHPSLPCLPTHLLQVGAFNNFVEDTDKGLHVITELIVGSDQPGYNLIINPVRAQRLLCVRAVQPYTETDSLCMGGGAASPATTTQIINPLCVQLGRGSLTGLYSLQSTHGGHGSVKGAGSCQILGLRALRGQFGLFPPPT